MTDKEGQQQRAAQQQQQSAGDTTMPKQQQPTATPMSAATRLSVNTSSSSSSSSAAAASTMISVTVAPFTGGPFCLTVNRRDSIDDLKKAVAKKLKVLKDRICLLYRERYAHRLFYVPPKIDCTCGWWTRHIIFSHLPRVYNVFLKV